MSSYFLFPKDELQTAIELSLQEAHKVEEEEREFHRYKTNAIVIIVVMNRGSMSYHRKLYKLETVIVMLLSCSTIA